MPTRTRRPLLSPNTHRQAMRSLEAFSHTYFPRHALRPYQLAPGEAILRSILDGHGYIFTVLMARQAGKNELQAQLEAYLLHLFASEGGSIVKAAPTFDPQIIRSRDRLAARLNRKGLPRRFSRRDARTFVVGSARLSLLSAAPAAEIVGETADLLLEVDEAQSVDETVYNRDLRPMLATRAATTALYGTSWHDDTILEQQRRLNILFERDTGIKLNFEADASVVLAHNPRYEKHLNHEIARLGRDSLPVRTQYFLECVPEAGRLFPPDLLSDLRGAHLRHGRPNKDYRYVFGVDVAGADHDPALPHATLRDRAETVVLILALDPDETLDEGARPTFLVSRIVRWKNVPLPEQTRRVLSLIAGYEAYRVAVDATGVGAHLAAEIRQRYPSKTDCVTFTPETKSALGYDLRSALETGRIKFYADADDDSREAIRQLAAVRYEVKLSEHLAFSAPRSGHDDCVMALALAVRAVGQRPPSFHSGVIPPAPEPDYDAMPTGRPSPLRSFWDAH